MENDTQGMKVKAGIRIRNNSFSLIWLKYNLFIQAVQWGKKGNKLRK